MMKNHVRYLILALSIFTCMSSVSAQDAIDSVVRPFLQALQTGDVKTLESCIAGGLYDRTKVLLTKNTDYPEFLRTRYASVEFSVGAVEHLPDETLVHVYADSPSSSQLRYTLVLKPMQNQSWKIVDQREFQR